MAKKLYPLVIILVLCCASVGFFVTGFQRIHLPFQFDYGEGMVWWQSVHITDYSLAYKSMDFYPYMVVHYPPVYHLTARWVAGLIGDWMLAGRLVSLLSAFGVALAIGGLVFWSLPRRSPLSWRLASAMFAACVAFPIDATIFATLARVDMLSILLMFAGLAVFIIWWRHPVGPYLAMALFALAEFTKQTSYTAILAALIAMLLVSPVRGLRIALFGAGCGAVPLAYLVWATHGGFLLNTISYNVNPFSVKAMAVRSQAHLEQILPVFAMAVAEALMLARRILFSRSGNPLRRIRAMAEHSPSQRALLVLSLHLVLAGLQSLGIGKQGAWINYFIPVDLNCGALAGFFLFRTFQAWNARTRPAVLPAAACLLPPLLVFIALLPLSPPAFKLFQPSQISPADQSRSAAYAEALRIVRATPGLVYTDDMSLLMRAGKEFAAEPSIVTNLSITGRWDETPLLKMILEHKFDLILLILTPDGSTFEPDRESPKVREAILAAYGPGEAIAEFTVFRPKAR